MFDPHELPLFDAVPATHPKVQELRALSLWSEGKVWISPERHGAITGVFKNQIDWLPLDSGSVRPTQGRTLAVMHVCGGSQSFNVVNTLHLLGRWMRRDAESARVLKTAAGVLEVEPMDASIDVERE